MIRPDDTGVGHRRRPWRRNGEVDDFIADLFVNPDPALDAALEASEKAGLPAIEVSPRTASS